MRILSQITRDCLHWLLTGLRWPLPENIRQLLFPEAPRVIIQVTNSGFELFIPEALQHNKLVSSLSVKGQHSSLPELLAQLATLDKVKATVAIPYSDFLVKTLSIPKGANDKLESIVRFELERVTPFNLEQIYYDFFVADENANKANIFITAFLVTSQKYQDLVELCIKNKIAVSCIDDEMNILPINITSSKKNHVQSDYLLPFSFNYTFVFLICLSILLLAPLLKYDGLIQELETEIANNRSEALSLRESMLSFNNQNSRGAVLDNYRINYLSPLNLLENLSQSLPQDTWLRTFSTSPQFIQIQGESPSAAQTLALIERSPYLENAEFSSPVSNVASSDKEEFHIIATARPVYDQ
ncbi:MAG: hypothetical protein CMP91_11925 [Gammaproteobacteria bacterium]|nr:hypothetical protein [Gammaproteobacteria bacterium]|tara:strand:- start:2897 stop:3964 length:1068 start_codon:yes stop_codon:yes gene_type:complete